MRDEAPPRRSVLSRYLVPETSYRSATIFILPMKIDDQLRTEVVAEYLNGTMTQEQVRAVFEARTGLRLSPRTLRSWLASRVAGPVLPTQARARLSMALQSLRDLQAEIEAMLGSLDDE